MNNVWKCVIGAALGLCVAACGSEDGVPNASCSGGGVTAAVCVQAAMVAGCGSQSFLDGECTFRDCDSAPSCSAVIGERDAGSDAAPDATVDPACVGQDDGLFANCDLCPDTCGMVTFNGATYYTCQCPGACPCGFECGSTPAPGGGVLSSVCAPPRR